MLANLLFATLSVLNDDGGWCWFEDERVIVHNNRLILGTVASGTRDPGRRGDIEATIVDLQSGEKRRLTLHDGAEDKRWYDDHNSPAFVVTPDNQVLAMYAKHGVEASIYYRLLDAGDEQRFVPSETSKITYTNLHWLSAEGRIYDFFRGLHNSFKPSYAWSDDGGRTWAAGNVFIDVPTQFRHRPYVKYASNGRDTVHIAYTEGHPRDFDNSVYHIFYRKGQLHASGGQVIRSLKEGLRKPEEGTRVFAGDPNHVAWTSDIHLDAAGDPVIVFSVQVDSAGLPSGTAGRDHRYYYARWKGGKWTAQQIAYGGSRLYAGEDDYTGNIALDPQNIETVYISTNADPVSGAAMPHYEIFRGTLAAGKWKWTAITSGSSSDNIRPIVPISRTHRILVWLRGKMTSYTNYQFEVVGSIQRR